MRLARRGQHDLAGPQNPRNLAHGYVRLPPQDVVDFVVCRVAVDLLELAGLQTVNVAEETGCLENVDLGHFLRSEALEILDVLYQHELVLSRKVLKVLTKKPEDGDYPSKMEQLATEIARLETVSSRFSLLRILSFTGLVLGALGAIESVTYPLVVCSASFVLFLIAVLAHGRTLDRKEALEDHKLLLEETELRARTRRRDHLPPQVPSNPTDLERGLRRYRPEPESLTLDDDTASDLNLLDAPLLASASSNRRTLFGFLDWSSTIFGSRRLRHMLLHPLRNPEDIRNRQEAVREVEKKTGIREALLTSLIPLRRHSLGPLTRFFSEPSAFVGRITLLIWTNLLGTAAPVCLLAIVLTGNLDLVAALIGLVIVNVVTIGANVKRANPARDRILLFGPLLAGLLRLEATLSTATLSSPEWVEIGKVLQAIRPHARKLKRYVGLLSLHSFGPIFELINILTLWELRILPLADSIFARHRGLLEHATGAMGEAEALLCYALPLAEDENFELPEIVDGEGPLLCADELGHPLLDKATLVRNPVSLRKGNNVLIVTGSNMAGKSTYLKAVAVNLVLASAGGPVCAAGFRWTPMALYSDINIVDSLDGGKSYFQVEVERVRTVIESALESPFLLAIFDELFRGTNSSERLALANAIIRFVRSTGALLIVATHDHALTHLVTEGREPGMENRHLREHVEDGVMRFDYRLRDGPATTRNAIRVLEAHRYPEEITREAKERSSGGEG